MFYRFLFSVYFKLINPIVPAIKEESRMMNFALLITVTSSKAKRVTKMDIVNPIPPNIPTPAIFFQFKFFGNLVNFSCTAKKQNVTIPIGFPNTKPNRIPKE